MQAVIRAASGISDEQSRKTSPVQSRRWSSCVKAWLADGNIARQKARLEMILKFRTFNRSMRIVAPKSRPTFTAIRQAIRRLGINHDCIETSADASSLLNNCAPEFSIGGCISSVLLFHDGTLPAVHKVAGPLALFAHRAMSDFSPLIAPKRTWIIRRVAASDSCGLQWALILPRHPHIHFMAHWQGSITRQPPKTKAELRQMLAQAVRNTQASADRGPKRLPKAKKIAARAAYVE